MFSAANLHFGLDTQSKKICDDKYFIWKKLRIFPYFIVFQILNYTNKLYIIKISRFLFSPFSEIHFLRMVKSKLLNLRNIVQNLWEGELVFFDRCKYFVFYWLPDMRVIQIIDSIVILWYFFYTNVHCIDMGTCMSSVCNVISPIRHVIRICNAWRHWFEFTPIG